MCDSVSGNIILFTLFINKVIFPTSKSLNDRVESRKDGRVGFEKERWKKRSPLPPWLVNLGV